MEDGFGDEPGNDNGMPLTTMRVRLADRSGGGTRSLAAGLDIWSSLSVDQTSVYFSTVDGISAIAR